MKDEWPPPYEYVGSRLTWWARIARDFGDPIAHRHSCPECYEHVLCTESCTLEPDLEEDDGTPYGSHMVCRTCLGEDLERVGRQEARIREVAKEQLAFRWDDLFT